MRDMMIGACIMVACSGTENLLSWLKGRQTVTDRKTNAETQAQATLMGDSLDRSVTFVKRTR